MEKNPVRMLLGMNNAGSTCDAGNAVPSTDDGNFDAWPGSSCSNDAGTAGHSVAGNSAGPPCSGVAGN